MSPLGAWGAWARCVGRASVLCAMACALGLAWGASEQPEPASGRPASAPARFARQAVVSAHPEASRAGAFILATGGNAIDAETAERWGLVNRVVEPAELMQAALKLADDIAANDPSVIRHYNALIDENFGLTYADAIDNEHRRSRDANQSFRKESLDREAIATKARNA